MQMKVQRHSHKRRVSLLTEDCSLAIGNTSSQKRTTSVWETKLLEMDTWVLTKVWTVNEQGVQWDFTNEEMRNKAFRKIVAENPFLLMGAHPCANSRSRSNASWSRMTQREKDDESPSTHAVCLSLVQVAAR